MGGLRGFLLREWYWSRRNLVVLLVLLIAIPAGAALGTAAFQQTIPEDIPIGVVAQDDDVTADELSVIRGGTALYASPIEYDTGTEARSALEREEVYLIIEVPHGLFDEDHDVVVRIVSDDRLAPFQEPANYTASVLESSLDSAVSASVTVEHERIGMQSTLSEYLVPTALMVIVILLAFLYIPLELFRERDVFDRVSLVSRIEIALLAKLLVSVILLVIPLVVFQLVSMQLGYRLDHFNLHTMSIIGLTFVYAACIAASIMFFARLSRVGLFANLLVLGGVLTMSSFIYPVGFFSSIRKQLAQTSPFYHSMVITRSTLLKDLGLPAFSSALQYLFVVLVASLLVLQLSIIYYRRRT